MKDLLRRVLMFVVVYGMMLGVNCHAFSFTLDLTKPTQPVFSGGVLSFEATVTLQEQDPSMQLFLNGFDFTAPDGITISFDPFYNNFPLYLNAGDAFTAELFTAQIDTQLPGLYAGTVFLRGGADGNAQDILAFADFNINVLEASNPVPEPATLTLLGVGLAGLYGFNRRRRALQV